jgi:choline-glycine betaine transporter
MDLEVGTTAQDTKDMEKQRAIKKKPLAGGYGGVEDRSTWVRIQPSHKNFQWAELWFNPVVTFVSLSIILAFALWAMILPDDANAEFADWKTWVGTNFTWLYIGSQDAWAVFIMIAYLSKYSNIKLGPNDSKPEYNDASWFSLVFACGVSTGLFFYGVAEPLYHYIGPNRYTADPTLPDAKLAQEAINVTLYHWGLHG